MAQLTELKDALQELGLSPNAIACYVESYCLGPATAGSIAKACGMDRSSAYLALGQLKELGLLAEDVSGAPKKVWAKHPKAVIARLRTNMRRLRKHSDAIEESMDELLAPYAAMDSRPVLQSFAGKEGLKRISDDILENADGGILLLSNFERESQVFSAADHNDFIDERIRRGISIRVIATDSESARNELASDKKQLRQTRIVAKNAFNAETYIYGNTVAMLDHDREVIGFIMRSKAFADSQRFVFEQLWKNCGANHERISHP